MIRIFIIFLCFLISSCDNKKKSDYPNIILVMTDDQGWGQAGYYNHPVLKTPNLDLMAKNGLRFDRFYAGAPQCSPTRASVLTGRNNDRTGVFYHGYSLNKNEKTIAQELKKIGYSTGHFGKWHLNGIRGPGVPIFEDDEHSPDRFGFDKWLSVTNFFDINPILGDNGNIVEFEGTSSEVIVNNALEFIEKNINEDKPSFAVIWDGSPHDPFVASEEDKIGFENLDKNSREHYGELVAFDRSIGILRKSLNEMGIANNTIIWYCSDNGGLKNISPSSVGNLRGNKNTMWEGGLRVPAIIEWPEKINPGITKYPVSTMDIFPTLLEIVGLYPDNKYSNLDGKTITNLFKSSNQKRTLKIPFRFDNRGALIDNNIKLVAHDIKKLEFELYDLSEDPTESKDISKSYPQVFELMKNEFIIWNSSVDNDVNQMKYNHPSYWVIMEQYIKYFDQWINRPEYSKWISRASRKEGPGFQNFGPLK